MKKNISWIWFAIVTTIELLLGYAIFICYPLISMLFLGEGANSFLYTNINELIWAISPLTILFFNIIKMYNAKKMFYTYKLISVAYSSVYAIFIIFWSIYNGFHI